MLERYAARWSLELDEIIPGGRLSACVAGRDRAGRPVVLKVPTSARAGRLELAALRAWQGGPVPKLRRRDARAGVFAMERILPGTPAEDDADAAAAILSALHAGGAAATAGYPPLSAALLDRLRRSEQRCALPGNDDGRALHARAAVRLGQPLPASGRPVLLHGDFQAKNLLAGADDHIHAIDPLPCVGDPAFDAAMWCVLSASAEAIRGRVERIARALGSDAAPIAEWAALLCALEYRPYRPEQARRMLAYVA